MFGIYRSTRQNQYLGVISGISERFNLDVRTLRIIYLIGLFFAFPIMFFGYFLLAIILPKDYPTPNNRYIQARKRIPAKKVSNHEKWGDY